MKVKRFAKNAFQILLSTLILIAVVGGYYLQRVALAPRLQLPAAARHSKLKPISLKDIPLAEYKVKWQSGFEWTGVNSGCEPSYDCWTSVNPAGGLALIDPCNEILARPGQPEASRFKGYEIDQMLPLPDGGFIAAVYGKRFADHGVIRFRPDGTEAWALEPYDVETADAMYNWSRRFAANDSILYLVSDASVWKLDIGTGKLLDVLHWPVGKLAVNTCVLRPDGVLITHCGEYPNYSMKAWDTKLHELWQHDVHALLDELRALPSNACLLYGMNSGLEFISANGQTVWQARPAAHTLEPRLVAVSSSGLIAAMLDSRLYFFREDGSLSCPPLVLPLKYDTYWFMPNFGWPGIVCASDGGFRLELPADAPWDGQKQHLLLAFDGQGRPEYKLHPGREGFELLAAGKKELYGAVRLDSLGRRYDLHDYQAADTALVEPTYSITNRSGNPGQYRAAIVCIEPDL